jgi:hypothetical protein
VWIVPLSISMIIMSDTIVHPNWDKSGWRVPYFSTLNMISTITYYMDLHIHVKILYMNVGMFYNQCKSLPSKDVYVL